LTWINPSLTGSDYIRNRSRRPTPPNPRSPITEAPVAPLPGLLFLAEFDPSQRPRARVATGWLSNISNPARTLRDACPEAGRDAAGRDCIDCPLADLCEKQAGRMAERR